MKRFLKFARNKSGNHSDIKSLSSLGSVSVGSVNSDVLGTECLGYNLDLRSAKKDKSFGKLHEACWLKDFDKVKKCIKKADVNAADRDQRTPLHLASAQGAKDIIWFLLGRQADTEVHDADGCTPLLKAVECRHAPIVQFLLDNGADAKASDMRGFSGLHKSAIDNQVEIARVLLSKGIDVDAINNEGKSALHLAFEGSHAEFAELLLRHGANVNAQDNKQRTSLMIVCKLGMKEQLVALLEYGADPTLVDENGWTAHKYALIENQDECLEILKQFSSTDRPEKQDASSEINIGNGEIENADNKTEVANPSQPNENNVLDSWSDESEDEYQWQNKNLQMRKKSIQGLNLTKFMSSIDVSDKDISDIDDHDAQSPILKGPPKPPRLSSAFDDEDKTKDSPEIEKLTSDKQEAINHGLNNSVVETATNTKNKELVHDFQQNKAEEIQGSSRNITTKEAMQIPAVKNNFPEKTPSPLHDSLVASESNVESKLVNFNHTEVQESGNIPKITTEDVPEIPSNDKDSCAISSASEVDGKTRLFKKNPASSHRRTPSGNITDVHPLLDTTSKLSDSDSEWNSDEDDVPVEKTVVLETQNKVPTIDEALINRKNSALLVNSKETVSKQKPIVLQKPLLHEQNMIHIDLSDNNHEQILDSVSQNLDAKVKEEKTPTLIKLEDEESDWDISLPSDEKQVPIKHKFEMQNELKTDKKSDNEEVITEEVVKENVVVLPNDHLKPDINNGQQPNEGASVDGTLGREDTLQGMDEVWENNTCVKMEEKIQNSDVSTSSDSPSQKSPNRPKLVRQDASLINDEMKIHNLGDNKIENKNEIDETISNLNTNNIQQDSGTLNDDKVKEDFPEPVEMIRKKSVSEIRRHFETLMLSPPNCEKIIRSVPHVRRLSLDTEHLDKIFQSQNAKPSPDDNGDLNLNVVETEPCDNSIRRHSIAVTPISAPPGITFKQLLKLRQLDATNQCIEELSDSNEDIDSLGNQFDRKVDEQTTKANERPLSKMSNILDEKERKYADTMHSLDDNNNRDKSKRRSSFLSLPNIKNMTKRFSLSLELKGKQRNSEKMFCQSLSNSLERCEDVADSDKKIVPNEKDDFVQEVLQRLDIRRRSSISIMNPDGPRIKKLSQSSSLERLSESDSTSSSDPEENPFGRSIHHESNEHGEKLKKKNMDQNVESDDDDVHAKLDALDLKIGLLKEKEPQAYLKLQDFIRELRMLLERESGKSHLLDKRLRMVCDERNRIQQQLETLHTNHNQLQQQLIELESQLGISQWELQLAQEEKNTCNTKFLKLSESLDKKDEDFLSELNLRQKSELKKNFLQNELASVNDNLQSIYRECASLQHQVDSSASVNQPVTNSCNTDSGVETEMLLSQLDSCTKQCIQLEADNQQLQDTIATYKQEIAEKEVVFAQIECKSKAELAAALKQVETIQEEKRINEAALKQSTLESMQEIQNMKANHEQLQLKLSNEQARFTSQVTSLQAELNCAHMLIKKHTSDNDEQQKIHIMEQNELKQDLCHSRNDYAILLQEKQKLSCQLVNANEKITCLENSLRAINQTVPSTGMEQFKEQMEHLHNELSSIKNHLTNNNAQVSPCITETLVNSECNAQSSPIMKQKMHEKQPKDHDKMQLGVEEVNLSVEQLEHNKVQLSDDENTIQKMKETILELEDKAEDLSHKMENLQIEKKLEKESMESKMKLLQHELIMSQKMHDELQIKCKSLQTELETTRRTAEALEFNVSTQEEVAKSWEKNHSDISSKWKKTSTQLKESVQKENEALTSLNKMEVIFQAAKEQLNALQMEYNEVKQDQIELEHQLLQSKKNAQSTITDLETRLKYFSQLQYDLQEQDKAMKDLEMKTAELKLENAQMLHNYENAIAHQQQHVKYKPTTNLEEEFKLIEVDHAHTQDMQMLDDERKNNHRLSSENDDLRKMLQNEKNKMIALQKEIAQIPSHYGSLNEDTQLSKSKTPAALNNASVPKQFLQQLQELKKQAEELKVKVKQEKEHRHRCEAQLSKAKKELSEMPQLRKSIAHLEEVRKELCDSLMRLQQHMKHQSYEQQQMEQSRHYYETLATLSLNTKWGQVRNFLEERNKVQEQMDQARLNNETQARTDLHRTMNELLEEVTHLRADLHQSQSQVESLQDQCNRLQELYNNEVLLRSQLTENLSRCQNMIPEPFLLTKKNLLKKNWKGNSGESKLFNPDEMRLKSNSTTHSEDSIVHKLKAELDKSIKHHLSQDFSGNLNNFGSNDSFLIQTKDNLFP